MNQKTTAEGTIPKKLHLIWVGDEAKRPRHSIDSWKEKHPGWEFRLWGNAELREKSVEIEEQPLQRIVGR